jgi:hypothetical protein
MLPRERKLSKMQDDVNMQMSSILRSNIALAATVFAKPACRDFVRQLGLAPIGTRDHLVPIASRALLTSSGFAA